MVTMIRRRHDSRESGLEGMPFVTPLQKIHIIEPFVAIGGFVHSEEGRSSKLRKLTIEEYHAEKAKAAG